VLRIRDYSIAMARALGLPDHEAERIGQSAILHDVGKLHTPDDILKKPGALTDEEWVIMRQHPVLARTLPRWRPR
jgi:HD-GYP domain-containing protein (c-di-GMP phosphodiesterase class II)